jgi:hypothetical protein
MIFVYLYVVTFKKILTMIKEVRYKGQKVNLKDIEVVYTDYRGEEFTGDIEDYGRSEWHEAWAECEAGEGW